LRVFEFTCASCSRAWNMLQHIKSTNALVTNVFGLAIPFASLLFAEGYLLFVIVGRFLQISCLHFVYRLTGRYVSLLHEYPLLAFCLFSPSSLQLAFQRVLFFSSHLALVLVLAVFPPEYIKGTWASTHRRH